MSLIVLMYVWYGLDFHRPRTLISQSGRPTAPAVVAAPTREQQQQQQQHKLYLHDYNYVVTVLQKL